MPSCWLVWSVYSLFPVTNYAAVTLCIVIPLRTNVSRVARWKCLSLCKVGPIVWQQLPERLEQDAPPAVGASVPWALTHSLGASFPLIMSDGEERNRVITPVLTDLSAAEVKYFTGFVKHLTHPFTPLPGLTHHWDFAPCACCTGVFQVTCDLIPHQSLLLVYLLCSTVLFHTQLISLSNPTGWLHHLKLKDRPKDAMRKMDLFLPLD